MLLRVRIDEYLVATMDHRWHTREKFLLLDQDILTEDEQEFCIEPQGPESIPVASVMLYHVGEEFLAIACRAVPDIDVSVDESVWFVSTEEACRLLNIFDENVLLEMIRIDDQKASRLLAASSSPVSGACGRVGVKLFSDKAELREALLNG
jgi:hypothetical protein